MVIQFGQFPMHARLYTLQYSSYNSLLYVYLLLLKLFYPVPRAKITESRPVFIQDNFPTERNYEVCFVIASPERPTIEKEAFPEFPP